MENEKINAEKQTILDALKEALRQVPGFGLTVVAGKAQPILKVITPLGSTYNVTVK